MSCTSFALKSHSGVSCDPLHPQIRVADHGHVRGRVGGGREDWARYSPLLHWLLIFLVMNAFWFTTRLFTCFNCRDDDVSKRRSVRALSPHHPSQPCHSSINQTKLLLSLQLLWHMASRPPSRRRRAHLRRRVTLRRDVGAGHVAWQRHILLQRWQCVCGAV